MHHFLLIFKYDNLMDNPGSFSPNSLTDTSLEKDDEMRLIKTVLSIMLPDVFNLAVNCYQHRSITDIAKRLHKSIDETEEFDMIVRRSSVLRDALNRMHTASFHPRKKLHVIYREINTQNIQSCIVAFYRFLLLENWAQILEG